MYRGSLGYENELVKITSYTEAGTAGNSQCYGRFIAFDGNKEEDKSSYSWTKCYECLKSEDYGNRRSTTPLFTMESVGAHVLGDGVLFISGRCDCTPLDPVIATLGSAHCKLKIGDYYWNGTTWTTTDSTFLLKLQQSNIKNTDTVYNHAEYDGTGIPITTPMTGKIYFAVTDLTTGLFSNGYLPLMDFKIGFVRDAEDDTLNDKNYTAEGGNFPDNVNIDTIFTTDKTNTINSITRHCQAGFGLIYNGNTIVDTIPFGTSTGSTTQQKPEQRVADTIAAYGTTIRRVMTVNLKNGNISAAMPSSRVTLSSQSFYPVSASHNWRDNILTLKMMEI